MLAELADVLGLPPRSERFVAVCGEEGQATVGDVEWERRAEQQEVEALSSARGAAERWTAAVSSLTGIFSIVVLVKGPDDVTGVSGEVGEWLVPSNGVMLPLSVAAVAVALAAITAFGRWRWEWSFWVQQFPAGVLTLVAAAMPLLILTQYWAWETVVIVALGVAVMSAALAVLAGGFAAYGLPGSRTAASGSILRARQRRQVRRVRNGLRTSLVAAVVAILAVATAIAATWTHSEEPADDPPESSEPA